MGIDLLFIHENKRKLKARTKDHWACSDTWWKQDLTIGGSGWKEGVTTGVCEGAEEASSWAVVQEARIKLGLQLDHKERSSPDAKLSPEEEESSTGVRRQGAQCRAVRSQ